jgi:hypothetical protein
VTQRKKQRGDRPAISGLELVQSDLSMNVFITLLSVLSVLTLAASSFMAAEGYQVPYKSEEPAQRTLALVRSWKPILQINPRIVVRDGRAYRLDMRPLALAFATTRPVIRSESFDDSTALLRLDPDPSAYRILIWLHQKGFPSELVAYSFDIADLAPDVGGKARIPDMLARDVNQYASIDIFFHANDAAAFWTLAKLLTDSHAPYRSVQMDRPNLFAFEYATSRFGFEDVYK